MVWPKKTSPATTTSTVFGGDYLNRVSDYLTNVDVASGDSTLQPKIATITRYKNQIIRFRNPADNNEFLFDVPAITEAHTIQFPLLPASKPTDEMVTRTYVQTLEGKVVDSNLNSIVESGAAQGGILKFTSTKYRNFARGTADDVLLTNTGNTDIVWGKVGNNMISAHTTTKISTTSKSLLNSQIFYKDEDSSLGAHYFDITQTSNPSPPSSGNRRFYVNQATGEASVMTSAGSVVSLEAQGTGGGGSGADEEVILREAGAVVGSGVGHKINFTVGSNFDISEDLANDEFDIKIADNAITDAYISTHTTTKISTTSKSLLNSNIVYKDQNNSLGSFYFDMVQIAAPANPAAGTRRFYVDSGTGKASIKDASGNTISLEEQGGGMAAGGTATGNGNGVTTIYLIAHGRGIPPTAFFVEPASVDALGFYTRTADATNIILTYQIAPPTGTGNLSYKWGAF